MFQAHTLKKENQLTLDNEIMNTITISGRIGQDAKEKQVGEAFVYTFTIADDYFEKGEKKTQWFRVDLWRKDNKVAPYLAKGTFIVVSGTAKTNEFEKEGEKRQIIDIVANSFQFGPKAAQNNDQSAAQSSDQSTQIEKEPLPF